MTGLLDGRVAFVTGGARGIGRAVAQRFAAEGAAVMLADVDAAEARAAAKAIGVSATAVDVTDPDSLEAAAEACARELGEADVLVANAGVLVLRPVLDLPDAEWHRSLDVNLTGVFLSCRTFARRMVARGAGGRIVVSSSLFGRRGGRENGAYSAAKFGVIGLVESLAAEVAADGVLVNAVCPGQVDTAMMRALIAERAALRGQPPAVVEAELIARIPLGRMASPEEMADVYVFLASPLARYVTGQALIADGGMQVA